MTMFYNIVDTQWRNKSINNIIITKIIYYKSKMFFSISVYCMIFLKTSYNPYSKVVSLL